MKHHTNEGHGIAKSATGVVWVTGGTRGLGAEVALDFCRDGWQAVASYNHDDNAAEHLAAKADKEGLALSVVKGDAACESSMQSIASMINGQFGRLDALVNNAGIGLTGAIDDVSAAQFQRVLEVNLLGKYNCLKAALPLLRQSESPCIVNIASASGVNASRSFTAYCSAAAGIIMLTRCAAIDLAPWGIRVNCISPSMMDSGMSQQWFNSQTRTAIARANPLGRLGTTNDVVQCVRWLCSHESSYINGENIMVTGGK